jgi:glycosyltransferase involved in cell wall biosynthesis
MKRVCFVVQMVYDIDTRVRRKAEALVAAGYSVDALALRAPQGRRSYTLNGVNVHTVRLGKQRGSLARYLLEYTAFFCWVFIQLAFRMPRRRYTIIDINTLPDFLVFAAALPKLGGAKLVLDMHEIMPEFYMSKYGIGERTLTIRLLRFLERISFQFADRVLTINKPVEDLLVGRGLVRSKSTIIMNSADESRFSGVSSESPVAEQRGGAKFVMIYHGTLTRIYGLDIAIEAFSLVHHNMLGAEFWILGSGTEQNALAKQAEQLGLSTKVNLVGNVPAHEIPAWLSRSDVGVLPIRRDVFLDFAFPNKLPELIIVGRPVIISRLKAIGNYFSEDALAYFEPQNASDLASRMLELYEDSRRRSRLAERARKEYAPIRWDVMKQRYLGLVARISGREPGEWTADSDASYSRGFARTR